MNSRLSPAPTPAQLFEQAVGAQRQGRLAEAARLHRAVLAREPGHFGALQLLGVIRAQQGQLDSAVKLLRQAVARNPAAADAHNNLGLALHGLGRHAEAAASYQQAIAINPRYAIAHNNLGNALGSLGRHDEAIACYEKALATRPDYAEASNNLGASLHALNRCAEALGWFEKALAIRRDFAEAHSNLGNALAALERHDEAIACHQRALAIRPDHAEALNGLGYALHAVRRYPEAIERFEKAVALRPDFAEAHANLGKTLAVLGRYREALGHFEQAAALRPGLAAAEIDLGAALRGLNRYDQAIRHYQRAIAIEPAAAQPRIGLGIAFQQAGRLAEARQCFETAVALEPNNPEGYSCLVSVVTSAAGDPHVAAMEALANDMTRMPPGARTVLHFALGKALAECGEQQRSFGHFLAGNALRRRQIRYDEAAILGRIERIRALFTAELMQQKAGLGDPSRRPIFILGMPRSGSTLVEQVLASHPKVFGAGERTEFRSAVGSAGVHTNDTPFPDAAPALNGAQLRRLAEAYLAALNAAAGDSPAERITDKLPANFRFVGLIHLALPNARIIHTSRDPIDTCLSCFSTLFETQPFTYDLAELGRYHRAYARLMEHWRAVLPPGVMLDVQYEALVADFEPQARRIVAHCGLDWDEACLAFHRAERPVKTASVTQVRQPIYRSSVGRWRPDGDILRPLFEGMGLAPADLPAAAAQ